MSIFATPERDATTNEYGVKVLFLHGLEGSSTGSKAQSLQKTWGALCPSIRTSNLLMLKDKCGGDWANSNQSEIDDAIHESFSDAADAVRYMKPDIIVGSSLGGALLLKLYAAGLYTNPGVFLAPAIPNLVADIETAKALPELQSTSTSWVFGEVDSVVPNRPNLQLAKLAGGNITVIPNDSHRLEIARKSGSIDSAILTCIELDNIDG